VVQVSNLAPGTYDVILYDQAHERARLRQALEVVGSANRGTALTLIGAFTGATQAQLSPLKPGVVIEGIGSIVELGTASPSLTRTQLGAFPTVDIPSTNAFNVPAIVRAPCVLVPRAGSVSCLAGETPLAEDMVLRGLGPTGDLLFQIDQLRMTERVTMVSVRARLGGDRTALEQMRAGHQDVRRRNPFAGTASLVSLGEVRAAVPAVVVSSSPTPSLTVPAVFPNLATREVVLRMPAEELGGVWHYAARRLSIGGPLQFHGPGYELSGTVLAVEQATGNQR